MTTVNLVIDDKPVAADRNATILDAARDNGIRIPTLCMVKGLEPKANCRLCVVEVERMRTFAPACATKVVEGMVIRTDSPRIRASRKTTLELLLSRHAVDCHHCLRIGNSRAADLDPVFCEMCFFCDCVRDGFCELQALAREYAVDALPYTLEPPERPIDASTGSVTRNPNKCVNCRRCVDTCSNVQTVGALGIVNRGAATIIAPAADCLKNSACVQCGRCIDVCPTGAIYVRERIDEVIFQAHRYDSTTVAQVSADIVPRLAELSKMRPEEVDLRAVAAGLRKIGINYVMAEGYAQAQALQATQQRIAAAQCPGKPVLVAATHAAEKFVRNTYPDLAPQLLRSESAQCRFGELVRGDWAERHKQGRPELYTVSITQTQNNVGEAADIGCVDYVINANELYRMFMRTGVNI